MGESCRGSPTTTTLGTTSSPTDDSVSALVTRYLDWASRHPALYDAMFNQSVSLPFATPEAPAALRAGFDELRQVVRPFAANDDEDLFAEVLWSGLHGLVSLTRGGRLPREAHDQRLALLLSRLGQDRRAIPPDRAG